MSHMQDPPNHGHERHQTWTRDGFLISTDPSLISASALNAAFAQEWLYWAQPLPAASMSAMVQNSLCFGLFTPTPESAVTTASTTNPDPDPLLDGKKLPSSPQTSTPTPTPSATTGTTSGTGTGTGTESSMIGFARLITDRVTFAYLTDVYVLPAWQRQGLGRWLVACVQAVVEDMPWLRRSMLITGSGEVGMDFYKEGMRMERVGGGGGGGDGTGKGEVVVMSWKGPGSTF